MEVTGLRGHGSPLAPWRPCVDESVSASGRLSAPVGADYLDETS